MKQLHPIVRKASLALICVAILSVYISRVARVYLAQRSANSAEIAGLEHAIYLTPDNAELYESVGTQLLDSGHDYGRALNDLLNAVRLNPDQAWYWLELASLYQTTSKVEKENEAVHSALAAEPGDPEVAANAALLFMAASEFNRALPLFRHALASNPDAATNILPVCWRQTRDASLILGDVIPDSPTLQLQFLSMLTQQKETAAARQVWQFLIGSHKIFQPQLGFFYLDYLLHQHDVEGYERAWRDLAGVSPGLQSYLPNENLIVNSGFEQPLLNSGFDWRHVPSDHVIAGIDDAVAHSGMHSLSFSYDGNPVSDAGWKEFVPVLPNSEYEFSAWIKSENVISSSGPRIALVDAYTGADIFLTDDVLDTHPWQEMKGTFRVPAITELIAVKMVREPAATRIQGRVWIDDLRLVKR